MGFFLHALAPSFDILSSASACQKLCSLAETLNFRSRERCCRPLSVVDEMDSPMLVESSLARAAAAAVGAIASEV